MSSDVGDQSHFQACKREIPYSRDRTLYIGNGGCSKLEEKTLPNEIHFSRFPEAA